MPTSKTKAQKTSNVRKVRKVNKARGVKEGKSLSEKGQALVRPSTGKRPGLKQSLKAIPAKPTSEASKLSVDLFNISGKREGTISLPKEIFGQKPNKNLLSQALHIYITNSQAHHGSTKTRSEVRGGGAKPWRQKGTGRARAGSRRSPLWVGGAKALGPKPRKTLLDLPKKMKKAALISALSTKAQDNGIKIVSNFEKIDPKTKTVAIFLQKLETKGKTLFVVSASNQNINLATRNIREISLSTTQNLNTLEVIRNRNLIFSKEAMDTLRTRFAKSQQNK